LSDFSVLFEAIYKKDSTTSEDETEENHPTSPSDIPLSQGGSLILIASLIFSSVVFGSKKALPSLSIFPDHAKVVTHFIGTAEPTTMLVTIS